jgi:predicted dehydrogenase
MGQRIGVIGAGRWGRNLVSGLHQLDALHVVADESDAVRSDLVDAFPDIEVVDEAAAVFESDVDAVVIATPAPKHADLAIAALEHGKHVFVEKPFALTTADAERVVEVGQRTDRIVMVGHLLLYQPAILFLHDFLRSGAIGLPAFLHQNRLNLGTVRTAENALWSLGVHDVAAILYLIGEEPVHVDAWGQRILQPAVEDDVHLHLRFADDVEAHIHATWLWPERVRRLTVVGTEAMVTYDEEAQVVSLHRRRASVDLSVSDEGSEVLFRGEPRPLRGELEHFLSCVADGSTPRSDGRSAIPVIRVLEESARQIARPG